MCIGLQIGCTTHRRVLTSELRKGPSTRRGKPVPKRGRCVSCYARAPVPTTGSKRKKYMHNGDTIPVVSYACDVCRVVLCNTCFWHVYDHRCRGRPSGVLTLRWLVHSACVKTIVSLTLIFWFIHECEWTIVICGGFLCDFVFFCEQYYFFEFSCFFYVQMMCVLYYIFTYVRDTCNICVIVYFTSSERLLFISAKTFKKY